jgi:hypothetical protein
MLSTGEAGTFCRRLAEETTRASPGRPRPARVRIDQAIEKSALYSGMNASGRRDDRLVL